MLKLRKKDSGFTLIELLVVVIIVAVLAAVGVPLLSANVERAKLSEAEAGLGTIRTSMRAKLAENGPVTGFSTITTGALDAMGIEIGLAVNDLDGRFFATEDYHVVAVDPDEYCADVIGDRTGSLTAPRAGDVAGITRSMDEQGNIGDAACSGTSIGGTLLN